MAPSPENDNTPKAPDKNDKIKPDKHGNNDINKEKSKDFKTLNNLNDCELKDLLDEAITYKNPKDREGKSTLFKELLIQAEESERNARAASAGGSEQVRYCNTSAKRSKHRRKPNSISENVMHGGSLDNLAKEELFEVAHHLNRPKRTVSARQREGGSLPSNVNAGSLSSYDPHFLEEARRKRVVRGLPPPEPMDVDMESVSLLDHDAVAENFDRGAPALELTESAPPQGAPKFTTKATLQVNVDDPLHFNDLDPVEKKPYEIEQVSAKLVQSKYSVYIQNYNPLETTKKVDENGNALHQNVSAKGKKKKVQSDKNVVSSCYAEKVEGHRSDIINDVNKLLEFIGEDKPQGGALSKTSTHRSSKQVHKHTTDDGARSGKKQRAQSSKGKENRSELKKSNSLGEISTTKLESFQFDDDDRDENEPEVSEVIVRVKKEAKSEKPRERRSWGNVEHQTMQDFYKNPSTETVESASASDFRVVTKKKKTKKRRNSVSGSRRKTSNVTSNCANSSKSDGDRASSPDPRRKSACSVPHSERSNDSSDVDSVHSLPIDTSQRIDPNLNSEDAPISYADIARNSERKQLEIHKKMSPETKIISSKENSPPLATSNEPVVSEVVRPKIATHTSEIPQFNVDAPKVPAQTTPPKAPPPDVHNIKSFPAIQAANNKTDRPGKAESKSNNVRGGNNRSQGRQQNMVQCNNMVNVNRTIRTQANITPQVTLEQRSDIQNDLSIIQANEIDRIQYNSQIMPTIQIPDVQTIEKIHFMNQPGSQMPPHLQQHVVPPQHVHMALPPPSHHQQLGPPHHVLPMVPMTDMFTNVRPPPVYTAVITHNPHHATHGGLTYVKAAQAYEGSDVTYTQQAYLGPKGGITEGGNANVLVPNVIESRNVRNTNLATATTQTNTGEVKHKSLGSNKSTDDENANSASSRQTKSKYNKKSHPVTETKSSTSTVVELHRDTSATVSVAPASYVRSSTHSSPIPTVIAIADSTSFEGMNRQGSAARRDERTEPSNQDDQSAANCDNRTNASDCAWSEDSPTSSRPPVVILSGAGNKEVHGLEFGFDVNEQLLNEDICDSFTQRYVPPPNVTETSHNHDNIVNFIGSSWDDVCRNDSSGNTQYYTEDSL